MKDIVRESGSVESSANKGVDAEWEMCGWQTGGRREPFLPLQPWVGEEAAVAAV